MLDTKKDATTHEAATDLRCNLVFLLARNAPSDSAETPGWFDLPEEVQSVKGACNRPASAARVSVCSSDLLPSLAQQRDLRQFEPFWSSLSPDRF